MESIAPCHAVVSTVQLTRRSTARRERTMLILLGAVGFQASIATPHSRANPIDLINAPLHCVVTAAARPSDRNNLFIRARRIFDVLGKQFANINRCSLNQ